MKGLGIQRRKTSGKQETGAGLGALAYDIPAERI
jgi:hypothetical protein